MWVNVCRRVEARLPLLAGGELIGLERREVERHVLCCASCRARLESSRQALNVLHAVSERSPSRPDAASLWPEIARQIRESRRPAVSWGWPRIALRAGLAAGLVIAGAWALSPLAFPRRSPSNPTPGPQLTRPSGETPPSGPSHPSESAVIADNGPADEPAVPAPSPATEGRNPHSESTR